MASQQIDQAQWASFFDNVTKSLAGKQAQIEVASLDLGDQIEAQWVALIGITYDQRNDLVEIALEKLDHLIRSPREVFADSAVRGLVAFAITDGDGNRQIVRLRDPLSLPAAGAKPDVNERLDEIETGPSPMEFLSFPGNRAP